MLSGSSTVAVSMGSFPMGDQRSMAPDWSMQRRWRAVHPG
ncbi:hypothetical protein I549_3569 [Mycobacterium avium subsp. avium 2285 (R)]|nr:hypothetical protein I549_3569 [Mycobacterium avium subsp. avium 2285 (R)]